jgi:hypothetical protein
LLVAGMILALPLILVRSLEFIGGV